MADVLTPDQRKKNMQHIRSKDTKIEMILRKALWKKGYRFRKNYSLLPGKPDIVFTKEKIVIFCDGEFFHGKDWEYLRKKLENSNNGSFWIEKIERNINHDIDINKQLSAMGWRVIRFWGKDIKRDPEQCVRIIEERIFEHKISDYQNRLIDN